MPPRGAMITQGMKGPRSTINLEEISYRKSSLLGAAKWQASAPTTNHRPTLRSKASHRPRDSSSTPSNTISILTYNVWFGNLANDRRYPALLDLICRTKADVVCLQEVTDSFIRYLLAHEGIRKAYLCLGVEDPAIVDKAGADGKIRGLYKLADKMRYGCLVLLNRHATQLVDGSAVLQRFPDSRQDRRLLSLRIDGVSNTHTATIRDLAIGTAHFESPTSARDTLDSPQYRAREAQLRYSRSILPPRHIVCGDTNIYLPEEDKMPERLGYTDAFIQVHDSADDDGKASRGKGYTFPTSHELPNFDKTIELRRLDRVLLSSSALSAVEVEVLGMEERVVVEAAGGLKVPLSDHGAVLARVRVETEAGRSLPSSL